MKEALDEPEVKRRGMLKTYKHRRVGDVPLIGSNYRFSDTPIDDTRPPPRSASIRMRSSRRSPALARPRSMHCVRRR